MEPYYYWQEQIQEEDNRRLSYFYKNEDYSKDLTKYDFLRFTRSSSNFQEFYSFPNEEMVRDDQIQEERQISDVLASRTSFADVELIDIEQFFLSNHNQQFDSEEMIQNPNSPNNSGDYSRKTSKKYKSTLNGRKNTTKYFGYQLQKHLKKVTASQRYAQNQAIDKFIRCTVINKQKFKALSQNVVLKKLALNYLNGGSIIINTMNSAKIHDKRWTIGKIKFFRSLVENSQPA